MLATAFPRIPGDVGCPDTFDFPVRYAIPDGATVEAVVDVADQALLPRFIVAGRNLVAQGCCGITTTCGFLARWQVELKQALQVPVATSALLLAGPAQRALGPQHQIGIVTFSESALDTATLAAAQVPAGTPIAGIAPDGYFARAIRIGAATLDQRRMAADVVAAALRLRAAHPGVGAILLECANMPPYAGEVAQVVGLPVFDAAQMARAFYVQANVAGGHDPQRFLEDIVANTLA